MEEVVRFFWDRFQRARGLDAIDEVLGKGSPHKQEALQWVDAYKATLSGSKQKDFDKFWNKFDKALEDWHKADPKKQKNMKNPLGLT